MDEIIKEIIRIDKEASRKLEEAERMKDEVVKRQIIEENQELRQRMQENVKSRLDKVRETERTHADGKIAALNEQKDAELAAMKRVFEENRQAWEDDLFHRVLGR